MQGGTPIILYYFFSIGNKRCRCEQFLKHYERAQKMHIMNHVNFIIIFSVVESEILDWKDILQKRLHKIYQKC